MTATADPGELDRAAERLRRQAQELEQALLEFNQAAVRAEWQGQAAERFQDEVRSQRLLAASLRRQLEEIAQNIHSGADEVRRIRAEEERRRQEDERRRQANG